jgi:hypothetical protein
VRHVHVLSGLSFPSRRPPPSPAAPGAAVRAIHIVPDRCYSRADCTRTCVASVGLHGDELGEAAGLPVGAVCMWVDSAAVDSALATFRLAVCVWLSAALVRRSRATLLANARCLSPCTVADPCHAAARRWCTRPQMRWSNVTCGPTHSAREFYGHIVWPCCAAW